MSIDNDLQPVGSITEGDRALMYFTDRYGFTRLIAERLNDPPAKEILFFYGAGGNGKSLLLAYLRKHSCKKLTDEQWRQWQDFNDERLAKALKDLPLTGHLPVPTALLDFAPGAKRRDADPFYGLIRIREDLVAAVKETRYTLTFPLHTYGCFLYLKKTNWLEEAKGLFPSEEATLLKEFGDLLKPIPGPGFAVALLDTINKYSGGRLTDYQKKIGLDEAEVQRLQAMEADAELILELPRLLAQDLNVAMTKADAPERVVLFFDTHEAFYGRERNFTANFFRDGWLRRLLRGLDTKAGIVVVVAGRDKPRWAEAGAYELNTQIPVEYVCLRSVEDFTEGDAEIFLREAGVQDASLRESLIRYARVEVGGVHPLHLGLCADVVLEAAAKGTALMPGDFSTVQAFQEKSAFLIETLLKYVDDGLRDAIRALSACRAFDFEIYQLLAEKLNFAVDRATFRRLLGFSFVRQVAQRGSERYRIHDLLRRLDDDDETVRRSHEVLIEHYQAIDKFELIYHLNQVDWFEGAKLWIEAFGEVLKFSRYDLCRSLLDIRQELKIENPSIRGITLSVEGEYLQTLSRFDGAKRAYVDAIAAHNQSLEIDPRRTSTLNDKGKSLRSLADLQSTLSEDLEAEVNYELAIHSFDAALNNTHDSTQKLKSNRTPLHNKGTALQGLANLQTRMSRVLQAKENYGLSIKSYDAALKEDSSDAEALNSKSVSLRRLGDLQMELSEDLKAERSYQLSIEALDVILNRTPYDVNALNNKGSSLVSLANLQAKLSKYSQAKVNYGLSCKTYDIALGRSPENVGVLSNKGASLSGLAELHIELSEYSQALASYMMSVESYNAALELAPDHVSILYNKGWALLKLATLQDDPGLFHSSQRRET